MSSSEENIRGNFSDSYFIFSSILNAQTEGEVFLFASKRIKVS